MDVKDSLFEKYPVVADVTKAVRKNALLLNLAGEKKKSILFITLSQYLLTHTLM